MVYSNAASEILRQMQDPHFMVHHLSQMGEGALKQALSGGFRMQMLGATDENGERVSIRHSAESLRTAHETILQAQNAMPEGLRMTDAATAEPQSVRDERPAPTQGL